MTKRQKRQTVRTFCTSNVGAYEDTKTSGFLALPVPFTVKGKYEVDFPEGAV